MNTPLIPLEHYHTLQDASNDNKTKKIASPRQLRLIFSSTESLSFKYSSFFEFISIIHNTYHTQHKHRTKLFLISQQFSFFLFVIKRTRRRPSSLESPTRMSLNEWVIDSHRCKHTHSHLIWLDCPLRYFTCLCEWNYCFPHAAVSYCFIRLWPLCWQIILLPMCVRSIIWSEYKETDEFRSNFVRNI